MLKQAVREMEETVEETTAAAARAIAGERLLAKDLTDHEEKATRWRSEAEAAAARGDDCTARQAIARAQDHDATARALAGQRSSAGRTAEALRGQVDAMRAKLAEARRRLDGLSARRQLVAARRSLHATAVEPPHGANGFARFERMRRQIEQAEAESEALGELYEEPGPVPDAEAGSREGARRIEAELTAIRERLRDAQGPPG
jgi:phage shock protein A